MNGTRSGSTFMTKYPRLASCLRSGKIASLVGAGRRAKASCLRPIFSGREAWTDSSGFCRRCGLLSAARRVTSSFLSAVAMRFRLRLGRSCLRSNGLTRKICNGSLKARACSSRRCVLGRRRPAPYSRWQTACPALPPVLPRNVRDSLRGPASLPQTCPKILLEQSCGFTGASRLGRSLPVVAAH